MFLSFCCSFTFCTPFAVVFSCQHRCGCLSVSSNHFCTRAFCTYTGTPTSPWPVSSFNGFVRPPSSAAFRCGSYPVVPFLRACYPPSCQPRVCWSIPGQLFPLWGLCPLPLWMHVCMARNFMLSGGVRSVMVVAGGVCSRVLFATLWSLRSPWFHPPWFCRFFLLPSSSPLS